MELIEKFMKKLRHKNW